MKFRRRLKEIFYPFSAIAYCVLGLVALYILLYAINIVGILLAP